MGVLHRCLEDNRRSTPNILAVAAAVLEGNRRQFPKTLRAAEGGLAALGPGEPVRLWEFGTAEDEAREVADEMRRLHDDSGERWGDMARRCKLTLD